MRAKFHPLICTHPFQASALREGSPGSGHRKDIVLLFLLPALPPPSWRRDLSRGSVYGKQRELTEQARSQEPRWQCANPPGPCALWLILTTGINQEASGEAEADGKRSAGTQRSATGL